MARYFSRFVTENNTAERHSKVFLISSSPSQFILKLWLFMLFEITKGIHCLLMNEPTQAETPTNKPTPPASQMAPDSLGNSTDSVAMRRTTVDCILAASAVLNGRYNIGNEQINTNQSSVYACHVPAVLFSRHDKDCFVCRQNVIVPISNLALLTLLWFDLSKPFKICLLAKWLSICLNLLKTLHNFLLLHYHTFQYPLKGFER